MNFLFKHADLNLMSDQMVQLKLDTKTSAAVNISDIDKVEEAIADLLGDSCIFPNKGKAK